jgi:CDP-diacylglycerol---serine O-phosphatidyltransferase
MNRGVYIAPSLFTLANLAAGMVSILFSADGRFTNASWAILAGIIMDMLDGRVARWVNATSEFGVELDSLSDLITFGVAPAILIYEMVLSPLGRPGIMIAIFFVMAAALRLARFNVKAHTGETTNHFTGLPVPAAAGIVASFVLSYQLFGQEDITVKTMPIVMQRMPMLFQWSPVMMLVLAGLMVSTIHYGNFKQLKMARPKALQTLAFIGAAILLVLAYPQNTLFLVFSAYVVSGMVGFAWRYYRASRERHFQQAKFGRRKTDRLATAAASAPSPESDKPWNPTES